MIASRIGSLVIEKICLKSKIIAYAKKKEYVEATKRDKLIEELLETSNMYRTLAGMILTLGICRIYVIVANYFIISHLVTIWVVLIVLFILFVTAFRKQTKHILSRVEAAKEDSLG